MTKGKKLPVPSETKIFGSEPQPTRKKQVKPVPDDVSLLIGKRFRELRIGKELPLQVVADKAGLQSHATVINVEQGTYQKLTTLIAIATKALSTKFSKILQDIGY